MKILTLLFFVVFLIFLNFLYFSIFFKYSTQNKEIKLAEVSLIDQQIESRPISLLFVGDIMMNRYVENKINQYGKGAFLFPFQNILSYLNSFDYVIANLEGPVSSRGKKIGSIYSFRMKPETAKALKSANIKIVNLANNHIFDYGKLAFEDTLKILAENGIKYYGISYEPLIIEKDGTKIGFLGFSDFKLPKIAVIDDNFSQNIKKAKEKVDVLIVSFHWGDEYQHKANQRQRKLAHLAIDAGADLVIGHHPHVIQNIEKYKDKLIFYSLGNFIFDQNFLKETMIGGGVELKIKDKKIKEIYFRKFYLNKNFQIEKISDQFLPYELEEKIYLLKIAKDSQEWQKGLMFVKKPVDYDGMIFIFPDKQIRYFWNQNTFVDLDVYWLNDDKIVGKDFLPSIEKTKEIKIINSFQPVNRVIEIIK